MNNLKDKIIERELRKLGELDKFDFRRYAEVGQMIIDMDLPYETFQKYMCELKNIRNKYKEKDLWNGC